MSGATSRPVSPRNRLDRGFSSGGPGLICYLPLGDPLAVDGLADRYVEAGVDVLEIGVPVPNPYVDGAKVRSSMARALAAGMTPQRAAEEIARLRDRFPEQAMVWMSYGSAVDQTELVALAASARVDGVLFPESARHFHDLAGWLLDDDIHLLHYLPRDAPDVDVEQARGSGGYLMLQAVGGLTGVSRADAPLPDSRPLMEQIRASGVQTPIALGIGLSTAEHVHQAVDMGADAVIVGSAVLDAARLGPGELDGLLRQLRAAVR